ncbi:MAG: type I pullulanase [Candidatus Izemoplasmatales bacterium]|jgi:pullulanase
MKKDQRKFYPYLDDFDLLTIIVPQKNHDPGETYQLFGNDELIDLVIVEEVALTDEIKLLCTFDAYIDLGKIYYVINSKQDQSELYTGKIVRTELFDNIYQYRKHDLGASYHRDQTKFKLWSPVAKSVRLELAPPGSEPRFYDMKYTTSGVWRLVVEGDVEGYRYRYHVYVNGSEMRVTDPYARASDANGQYAYVVNPEKWLSMTEAIDFSGQMLDAIIYEVNVRDFSMDPNTDFRYRGKYLSMIETGVKTSSNHPAGFDYLKELGITHVQIMPIIDFGGVDEKQPDSLYNWGYNPEQYFVPEGWYATDPDDPYARINELRAMINGFHKANIGVILDVVYNHVHVADQFPYEKLVPGYSYHVDRDGILTNVSGCQNHLATHRKMIRKLIIDSCLFWAQEYHVDGFRFDLMGLIDYETMNEIRQELHALSEHIIVYGEGWKMHQSNLADRMAHMRNKKVLYTIGFFNDTFRETIKGSTFDPLVRGFATGDISHLDRVREVLYGSALNRYLFKYTSQSINYVECHDNMTFYDKALMITNDPLRAKKQALLATSIVILAQGVPFIHMGQEWYRTKHFEDNTYRSGDQLNRINWDEIDAAETDIRFLRQLIGLRKCSPCFQLKSHYELSQQMDVFLLESGSILAYYNDGANLMVVFKPLPKKEILEIDERYGLLSTSGIIKAISSGTFELTDIGTYVFHRKEDSHDEF